MQGSTKQETILCIACMETCVYIFCFLTKLFGGPIHTLSKDEGERVGRSGELAWFYPRHPLVQAGEESHKTPLKEKPPVTDHVEIPFSLLAVTKLGGGECSV